MKKKKIILSAGGTGGHLFPAQALADQLQETCELLFVAGGLERSPFFERTYPYREISTATFSFSKPLQVVKRGGKVARGIFQARKILKTFSPDLVVGFGSFYTLPILAAAALQNVPILLHEQNAIPGKVNRLFSSKAVKTAITFPDSAFYLKGETVEVIYPKKKPEKKSEKEAWAYFGLKPGVKTLLVFGGSQGATKLNQLFLEGISLLPKPFQVLHFTGKTEEVDKARAHYKNLGVEACVKPFEKEIDQALQIADLAVCRAGAGTVTDLIAAGVPALLIPFPFATENHQVKNAMHLVDTVKGGRMVLEKHLSPERLSQELGKLEKELASKRENIQNYREKKHIRTLSEIILAL